MSDSIMICVKSHRAYDNLVKLIGRTPQGYFSWQPPLSGIYELSFAEWRALEKAKAERRVYWHGSITRARVDRACLRQCWSCMS